MPEGNKQNLALGRVCFDVHQMSSGRRGYRADNDTDANSIKHCFFGPEICFDRPRERNETH
jgi:hypothetical protein